MDFFFFRQIITVQCKRESLKVQNAVVPQGKMYLCLVGGGKVMSELTPNGGKRYSRQRRRYAQSPEVIGKPAIARESYLLCITEHKL